VFFNPATGERRYVADDNRETQKGCRGSPATPPYRVIMLTGAGRAPSVPVAKEPIRFATDSPVEGRVSCELVSEMPNSLLAGKIQGISPIRGLVAPGRQRKRARNQFLTSQFPTHPNREFFAALQGIKSGDQGSFRRDQGIPLSSAIWGSPLVTNPIIGAVGRVACARVQGAHRRGGPRVRILLPPAESQSLAGVYLRGSRTPAFRAGVPGCVPGAVDREPQGPPTSHQPAAISLSGHIPVPHFRRCGRDKLSG
jgi:hypothetical protein